jgi:uncharacterized membrane protein
MTPQDEGLPLPPARRAPPSPRPQPDLRPGSVGRFLEEMRSASEFRTGRYQDSLAMRSEVGGGVSRFVPFKDTGPDPLGEVQSLFEAAVVGDKPDPSTLGLLRAIGGALLTGTSSPIAAITDQYQAERIRELQKDFLDRNNDTLTSLSDHLGKAKRAIRELSEMLGTSPFDHSRLSKLLEQKRRLGNSALESIDAALARTHDPEERKRLEAKRRELTEWMAERDTRTAKESDEVGTLIGRLQGMEAEMFRQRGLLEDAAWSEGPKNQTSGGRVVDTSHHRPDAAMHAASLQDMLLSSKAEFDRMIAPE